MASAFEFALPIRAIPGLVLPAELDLSGNFVLRFGGVSLGKSGISIGVTGARGRIPGELGREQGTELRLAGSLPADGDRPETVAVDDEIPGVFDWRVGVDGLEMERIVDEFVFVMEMEGGWGRPLGVEGLEFCEGRVFSAGEVRLGLVLKGLVDRGCTGRGAEDGFGGGTEPERFRGVDGLDGVVGLDVTETVLEFRADVLWLEREIDERMAELLLIGLAGWPFSD